MARTNYEFEKRQKDIAKRKKKEEKLARKQEKNKTGQDDNAGLAPAEGEAPAEEPQA